MQLKVTFTADSANFVINGLDNVRESAPILAYNAIDVIANQVKRNARSYLGTATAFGVSWRPIGEWAIRSRQKNKFNLNPLLDTGAMRTGIKITSRTRGSNPSMTVEATDWKSEIHEYGHNNNGRPIPYRPFMGPAVQELEADGRFHHALEKFIDDNLQALAFDKTNRAAKWFYSEKAEFDKDMAPVQKTKRSRVRARPMTRGRR